ncbi:MAG: RHS repeat domain-containing protein [Thiotrichaceae bacterium]
MVNRLNMLTMAVVRWNQLRIGRIRVCFSYDANGRLIKEERPNGSVLTKQYNAAGQLDLKRMMWTRLGKRL